MNSNKDLPAVSDGKFREALNTNFEKIEETINHFSEQLSSKTAHAQNISSQLLHITDSGHISIDFIQKSGLRNAKKIAILGDSVARGLRANYGFADILKERTKAVITNLSVSGVNMSNNGNNNIYQQALKTSGNEVIIVQGTDDDWCNHIAIGTDDKDITTFYGGFCQVIQQLRSRNKGCSIIVATATRQAKISEGKIVRRDTDKNKLGLTLADYVDAQKEACTLLSVPYADLFYTDLIDPYNPAFRKMCMSEGLHPNEIGHQIIFQEICRNYFYYYG